MFWNMYFFKVNKNNPQLSENPEPKKILVQVSLLFRWPPKTWKGISTEKVYGGKKKKENIDFAWGFSGTQSEDIFCPERAKIAKSSPEHLPPFQCACANNIQFYYFPLLFTWQSQQKNMRHLRNMENMTLNYLLL